ncbi:two-partner secretion domain-containing protein [Mastigocoleus testarum]|uniref:Filamentous haemagglutinin FhaB/tRNA nuclease CdiA-like TPS domain-containing protein n=1 Tax=Mastigocoleus testarum BC008 TaxID=371196 RepID=A0A0V7ZK00_9CYAN|nr:S-layer family protein [Mastigocoleus testarum]KST64932.1 hypothetical protein BC008_19165 [Mastigocoleus testarum BC008]KST65019.1 hypothetical protein BC008_19650 [Mastigocoleus testarum BC008]
MVNISISRISPFNSIQGKIHWLTAIISLVCCSLPIYSERAIADIVADDTLQNHTVVSTPNVNLLEITGGTRPENGGNLFHSFTNFSLQSNETARFIHESGIQNIITRITGGSLSNIDGTIQTLIDGTTDNRGSANFFLINPSGIIFGENAKLDIGGSFFAGTAESIKFADGSFYSAVNSQGTLLLTVDVPVGLQYGSDSGDITVRGPGSNISFDFDTFSTDRSDRTLGLQVLPGKTLALVGGNVILSGGNLTAEQGRVELGSVRGEGLVNLISTTSGWNLEYEQVNNFQDINLTAAASVDVSGNGGGEVQVIGRNISLTDGSAILANTAGDSTGGMLSIKATEALEVVGFSFELPLSTNISADVEFEATGNAGEIQIDAKSLIVDGGGQIGSGTFGTGNGGRIRVKAEDIELNFGGPFGPSGLFTNAAFGTGNGGEIFIETNRLLVNEGATISSGNSLNSDGHAGNLSIKAQDIQLVGAAFGQFPSGLSASGSSPTGNGGKIKLETNTLKLIDGGQIDTSTSGLGNAGGLEIQANQIEVSGVSSAGLPSGIFANVQAGADGNGGLISLQTESLSLFDGGQVDTSTSGLGNAGGLEIQANQIEVSGVSSAGLPSGIFANVQEGADGNGGLIKIATESLRLFAGGQIDTSTFGSGNGGTLEIEASEIEANGFTNNFPSGLFSTTNFGRGGSLSIDTNTLSLSGGAQISSTTFANGDAGSLNIQAQKVELSGFVNEVGSSGLFSAAIVGTGNGGQLNLVTDKLNVLDGATISVSNFSSRNPDITPGTGNAGNLNIQAAEIFLNNDGSLRAEVNAGDRGNIFLDTDLLFMRRGSNITVNAIGTANGGNIIINSPIIVGLENSDIVANAVTGDGGNINITTQGIFGLEFRDRLTPENDITASSEFGVNGTVDINNLDIDPNSGLVELPTSIQSSQEIATVCSSKFGSSFAVTGRGGMQQNPTQQVNANRVWSDIRDLPAYQKQTNNIVRVNDREVNQSSAIIEASGWIRNSQGDIEFVAFNPNSPNLVSPVAVNCSN